MPQKFTEIKKAVVKYFNELYQKKDGEREDEDGERERE